MKADDLKPGTVLRYPYLWGWQQKRGETEGRKGRPVCMIFSRHDPSRNITHLFFLAISSEPPLATQDALAIPELDRRRAGLVDWKQAWITISEVNYDILERSHYLDTNQAIMGSFSPSFVRTIAAALSKALKRSSVRIDRTT